MAADICTSNCEQFWGQNQKKTIHYDIVYANMRDFHPFLDD
jgi:hypothetical protein